MESKQTRCDQANELIQLIASKGRKFFDYTGKVNRSGGQGTLSEFQLLNDRVYYRDGYTLDRIRTKHNRLFTKNFTGGGTLQALVMDLAEYIDTGRATNANNGYGGVYCPHWGYPKQDMKEIQEKAVAIGFSKNLDTDLANYL